MRKIISYGKQSITEEDIKSVTEALTSDFLTQGPKAEEFEKKFSEFVGARYAVSCVNATAGLDLAVRVLKKNTKKVLVPAITFVATSNSALYNALDVDFIDIDPLTNLMNLDALEEKLSKDPNSYQGVIVVTLAGYPFDLIRLKNICDKYGIWSIEDACHSPGAYVLANDKQIKSGSAKYTDMAIFSFHPVKHIACGEGGMITTNKESYFKKLCLLRSHGITKLDEDFKDISHGGWYYEMQELGFNYRLTEIQAALGLSQLSRIDKNLDSRNDLAKKYDSLLKEYPVKIPYRSNDIYHAFHLYIIKTERRDDLYNYLRYRGVICQIHYIPIYKHPYYKKMGFSNILCPNAETYYKNCISLPMYHSLGIEDFNFVTQNIVDFFKKNL